MECLNQITVIGKIVSPLEYSHECFGEKFYTTFVKSNRHSGVADILEVLVPKHSLFTEINESDTVEIIGRVSTHNTMVSGKNKLSVFIFAYEINVVENDTPHENIVNLEGFICKPPVYRETPSGREIADLLLASKSRFNKSSYIPSVAWGRNAKYIINTFDVKTKLSVDGRLQSRQYIKEGVGMTAYELSISKFDVIQEEIVNEN